MPAIERGDWDELESLAVINDSEFPVLFEQNVWELSKIGDGYQKKSPAIQPFNKERL
ncbi:hypothetical protein [Vibrio harveyi]|uniref:hypothetical protein n=1 Tax=Vibrio harveyi TaxID=669 RepID=UPI00217E3CC1|nr:hypothetical protein [Vibrio harveyi]